jgi:hypothetical protein
MRKSKVDANSPRRHNLETFVASSVLLVEGPDEFAFFKFVRPRDDVQIHVYEGKNQLQIEIRTILSVEGFDNVRRAVIVRDCDGEPKAALQSALTQWSNALAEPLPAVSCEEWFPDRNGREWCVWLIPNESEPGDLEHLIWSAVPETDHRSCVEQLMACLESCEPIPYGAQTKARLYSWLATQKEPIRAIHAALNERNQLFDRSHPNFERFAALIDGI